MRASAVGSVCQSACDPFLSLFDCWEDLSETCVEVAVEIAFVAPFDQTFCLCFDSFCRYRSTLGLENSSEVVLDHVFGFGSDKLLISMHLIVVSLLEEFEFSTVECIKFDTVDVSPVVEESHLFDDDYSFAEADTSIIAVAVGAFVFVADEHTLTVIPCRYVNSWTSKCRQDAVEQVLADCFCQCSHVISILGFVDCFDFVLSWRIFAIRQAAYAVFLQSFRVRMRASAARSR